MSHNHHLVGFPEAVDNPRPLVTSPLPPDKLQYEHLRRLGNVSRE